MNKATFLSIPLLLLFGCSSTIESEESVVQNMERVDNHTGLINHYKGHLEKRPEDVQIMQELAKVYFDKGDIVLITIQA